MLALISACYLNFLNTMAFYCLLLQNMTTIFLSGEKDKHIIGGYDCSFVSDLRKIKPTKNTETLGR